MFNSPLTLRVDLSAQLRFHIKSYTTITDCQAGLSIKLFKGDRSMVRLSMLDNIEEKLADCLEQHNSKCILEFCGDPVRLDCND